MGKAIALAVGGLIATIFARLAGDEMKAWIPWFTKQLLCIAVERLPEEQRERFSEEWASHVDGVPGEVGKLTTAVGCVWAAQQISCTLMYGLPLFQRILKRLVDLSVAAAMLLFSAPVFFATAALIKLERGISGSVFDRLVIPAGSGTSFTQYRFNVGTVVRKQILRADAPVHRTIAVSRFGQFLQQSGLSELPMLINVLRGDMVFLGPRLIGTNVYLGLRVAKPFTNGPNWQRIWKNARLWRFSTGFLQPIASALSRAADTRGNPSSRK